MKSAIVFAFLILGLKAHATNCPSYYHNLDDLIVSRQTQYGQCWLSVSNWHGASSLIYRDYLITEDGSLMVFNSYGPGDGSDKHGARVYSFFPRTQVPDVQISDQEVAVQTSNPAVTMTMSRVDAHLISVSGGTFTEDAHVNPTNNGGVELKTLSTLWLDSGFRQGADPTADSSRSSVFHDDKGKTCKVANTELFNSNPNDASFSFPKDSELSVFLKKKCPALHVGF